MTARFVLTGQAAEFSLRRLTTELQQRGYAATAVDLAEGPLERRHIPDGAGPLVMVTSQHLSGTRRAMAPSLDARPEHYAAPSMLRQRIGADLMVYVPHDLEEPVLACETPALGSFDLYCAPDTDSWWAARRVPTVVTGWVGDFGDAAPFGDQVGLLLLTNLRHALDHGGLDHLRATIPTVLAAGLAVKLPVWSLADPIAAGLAADGVCVLDSHLGASALIRSAPFVVTNGPSSVIAEARRLGHRPLCVVDPTLPSVHRSGLYGAGAVVCADADFHEHVAGAGVQHEAGPPFDVEAFLAAVEEQLASQAR